MTNKINRIGNWYTVNVDGVVYNVVIQRDDRTNVCDPSSILVFDIEFKLLDESELRVWGEIEEIMSLVDWKYDVVDE
jgi:hypothetical protein